jgi:hypothetical protein
MLRGDLFFALRDKRQCVPVALIRNLRAFPHQLGHVF